MFSSTEENYLKAIYHLSQENEKEETATNAIAASLDIKPATVTTMLGRLKDKQLVNYEKYGKVTLTQEGKHTALQTIRRHRLWELFLVEKLGFGWDKVHAVAEHLEHIPSEELIERLDAFLGHPAFDPHGHPIPDSSGYMNDSGTIRLSQVAPGVVCAITSVTDDNTELLQYLKKVGLVPGVQLWVNEVVSYDNSMLLQSEAFALTISQKVAEHLVVRVVS